MHTIAHILGIDTQQSYFYDFWSGFATQLPKPWEVVIGALWLRHQNCHVKGCWRLGKHAVDGTPWCSKHHENARVTDGTRPLALGDAPA